MAIRPIFERLSETPISISIRESLLVYPIIETTHVLCMALFFGMIITLDLRLLGLIFKNVPLSDISRQILPVALFAFAVTVTTGVLLVISDPLKAYDNIFFKIKMSLMILAGINAASFHAYELVVSRRKSSVGTIWPRLAGAFSLMLWILILACGRLMAYNWFDHAN